KFIQAPSPEIWRKSIFGGEGGCWRGKWGGLFLGYLLGKNFRRRDRDHLVPPRRMDAAVCRAEVCYPFGSEAREASGSERPLSSERWSVVRRPARALRARSRRGTAEKREKKAMLSR